MSFNEREIVAFIKRKDETALNYLYDRYAGALYAVILNATNHEETAALLFEAAFIKIVRDIHEFQPAETRLFTWMFRKVKEVIQAAPDPKPSTRATDPVLARATSRIE